MKLDFNYFWLWVIKEKLSGFSALIHSSNGIPFYSSHIIIFLILED